ncbi:hypothetical protein evm_002801 [Chilo suppressalis]|nr:hypothetical protein evm_002801 [Chilo suppressalis]
MSDRIYDLTRAVDPRMKRNESLKSVQRLPVRRLSDQLPAINIPLRSNSITIRALAQHSAYLAERALRQEDFVCFSKLILRVTVETLVNILNGLFKRKIVRDFIDISIHKKAFHIPECSYA